MNYNDLGYDNLLKKPNDTDLSGGINQANEDAIMSDGSLTWEKLDPSGNTPEAGATNNSAEIVNGIVITDVINARFDTANKYVLSDFTFSPSDYSGALKTGDITWNTSTGAVTGGTGIVVNKNGIVGASAGSTQFSILTNGNATFAGELVAASGTFGSITAGTLTGLTIKTSDSGKRIEMSGDQIRIYDSSGVQVGTIEGAGQSGIFDLLGMNFVTAGDFTNISAGLDGLIGIDSTLDLNLSTRKVGGNGGHIKIIAESGEDIIAYNDFRPNANGGSSLGTSLYGWSSVYLGSSGKFLTGGSTYIATNAHISPSADGVYDLGTLSSGWRYLYLGTAGRYLEDNAGELYFNNSPVGGSGTVTSVATSGAITGGTITTTGTISHSTSSGYKHIPSGGTTYYTLRNSSSGTASWTRAVYVGSSSVYFDSYGGTITVSQSLSPLNDGTQYLGDSTHGWGRVYIGNGGEYLYENAGLIYSNVGMYWNGSSTCNGILSAVGEIRATNGSIHTSGNVYTGGISANEGSVNCALVAGDAGYINLNTLGSIQVSTHLDPDSAGVNNLGGATRYWNDVSYKTLTDRGCLGWFDDGVEMQDGTILSDLDAIKAIQKHSTKKTVYGVPMLDYKTMPKSVYKKAVSNDGEELKRDENDDPYVIEKDKDGKDKKIIAQDGAETTALISIMFGAIKELTNRLEKLETK